MVRVSLTVAAIVIAIPFFRASAAEPQAKELHLEGYVYDSEGKPLGAVDVSVWVAGKEGSVAGTKTEETGKYSLDVPVKDAFDLSFSLSKYRTSVVKQLTEKHNQQISKVLYRKGERMAPAAFHANVQSLDRIMFLAASLPEQKRKEFLENFPDVKDGSFTDTKEILITDGISKDLSTLLEEEADTAKKRVSRLSMGKNP